MKRAATTPRRAICDNTIPPAYVDPLLGTHYWRLGPHEQPSRIETGRLREIALSMAAAARGSRPVTAHSIVDAAEQFLAFLAFLAPSPNAGEARSGAEVGQ